MKEPSVFRIVVGVLLVVALIAAATAVGWMAYNAGLSQGTAQVAGASPAAGPYGIYGPYAMPAFGLGWLGCLVPLAFLCLVFSLFRLVVWGGMRRHMHEGWGPRGACVPGGMRAVWHQRMDEWHRQAHSSQGDEPPASQPSA